MRGIGWRVPCSAQGAVLRCIASMTSQGHKIENMIECARTVDYSAFRNHRLIASQAEGSRPRDPGKRGSGMLTSCLPANPDIAQINGRRIPARASPVLPGTRHPALLSTDASV
nr:hypothetical protein CFP56_76820 [Quercus suber]